MKKLVCESLYEFKLLNEADDREGGAIVGAAKNIGYAVKAAPGRALRWTRAVAIITKYKQAIPKRIEKTFEKYIPNVKELVENITKRHDAVTSSSEEESVKKNQIQEILKDGADHMQEVLKTIKDAMEGQLKVYADSIGDRLERTGTITNVKFTPGQKRGLLTKWRGVEDEAHKLMQEKFIKLMSDPQIAKFQLLKAKMDAYIEQMRFSNNGLDLDDISDETTLKPGSEEEIYKDIINTYYTSTEKLKFDKEYKIVNRNAWKNSNLIPDIPSTDFVGFVIDNTKGKVAYAFYEQIKNRQGSSNKYRAIRSRKDKKLYYFIEESKKEGKPDADKKLQEILTTIK